MKRNVNNNLMSMERKQYGAVLRQLVNAAVEVVRRNNCQRMMCYEYLATAETMSIKKMLYCE